jgi:hypothetical protein
MIVAIALFCAGCLVIVTCLYIYKECRANLKLQPKPETTTIVDERLAQAQTQRTEALSEANRALDRANEILRTNRAYTREIGPLAREAFRNAWTTMSISGVSMRDITSIQTALMDAGLHQNPSIQITRIEPPTKESTPPNPSPSVETLFDHLRKDTDDASI